VISNVKQNSFPTFPSMQRGQIKDVLGQNFDEKVLSLRFISLTFLTFTKRDEVTDNQKIK
jgi:hypothetical protein